MKKIERSTEAKYMDWSTIDLRGTKGTNSIAARAARATEKLDIQIKQDEDGIKVEGQQKEIKIRTGKEANRLFLSIIRKKW